MQPELKLLVLDPSVFLSPYGKLRVIQSKPIELTDNGDSKLIAVSLLLREFSIGGVHHFITQSLLQQVCEQARKPVVGGLSNVLSGLHLRYTRDTRLIKGNNNIRTIVASSINCVQKVFFFRNTMTWCGPEDSTQSTMRSPESDEGCPVQISSRSAEGRVKVIVLLR